MAVPSIPAPRPGGHTPEGYLQMSNHYLEQSRVELQAGDLVQASEKLSGSVATALKAIAQQREWRHDSHALRHAVVSQLGTELGPSSPTSQALFQGRDAGDIHHESFFENFLFEEDVLYAIEATEGFIRIIEQLMDRIPLKPFTVDSDSLHAHRIYRLTGHEASHWAPPMPWASPTLREKFVKGRADPLN